MFLPNDLTIRQLGELGLRMGTTMDAGDFVKLVLEHPERLRGIGIMAWTLSELIPDDGGEGEG